MISNRILHGNNIDTLKTLPNCYVDCCITSPPYYGLRDYGIDGQIGLEETPEEYIQKLVLVFREIKRVLRGDGTLWINIGDSYAGSNGNGWRQTKDPNRDPYHSEENYNLRSKIGRKDEGYKPKDLIGIPWMLAFALRADGWYLRQDIIWHKPNPMPESVTDRCTKAHEYIFLMSKSARYYFNNTAIQEPAKSIDIKKFTDNGKYRRRGHVRRHAGFNGIYAEKLAKDGVPSNRNRRDVWTVATRPYSGAHFAVFPESLILPCVLAGCKEGGTVLDPFMGSGTTAVVALKNLRKYIGCEINHEYIQIAERRIAKEKGLFNE